MDFPFLLQSAWLQNLQDDFLISLYSCLSPKPAGAMDPQYSLLFFSKYDAKKLVAALTMFSQRVGVTHPSMCSPGTLMPVEGLNQLYLIFFYLILKRALFQSADLHPRSPVEFCAVNNSWEDGNNNHEFMQVSRGVAIQRGNYC